MSIVADFQQRLKDITPPLFRIVGGAADFASISDVPKATPAVYVFVEEEVSGDNERMTGPVLQRMEADVAVVLVTRSVADTTGAAAAGEIEALKAATRAALIGFVPGSSQDGTPVTHIGGALLKAKGGYVWHRELFGAATYLTEA